MFTNFNKFVKAFKNEEHYIKVIFVTIKNHADILTKNFRRYFMTDDNLEIHFKITPE